MDRRAFVASAVCLLASPLAAKAHGTPKIPRVGIVAATSPAAGRHSMDTFRRELQERGYIEGQSILLEERWADGQLERFRDLIAGLLRSDVDAFPIEGQIAIAQP